MIRSPQPPSPVKAPCQQRSRDSLERILKSAEALIRSKGYESLTIAEVVRRSRTSTGTFYARFPDKTALLYAVHERVLQREEQEFRDRLAQVPWDELSLEESVRRLVSIKRELTKGTEKLYEAFVVCGATDPLVRERGYRSKALEEDLEVEILMRYEGQMGCEDPERAARVACRLWQAAREENVQRSRSGVTGSGCVSQDAVMEEIGEAIIAYLKAPAGGGRADGAGNSAGCSGAAHNSPRDDTLP